MRYVDLAAQHAPGKARFIVLDGELMLDIEGQGTVVLGRHVGYTVPKGVVHRNNASRRIARLAKAVGQLEASAR